MAEYNSLLRLIEDLNGQIQHFENMKSDQQVRWKELRDKEKNFSRLTSEAAGALEAVAGLLRGNEELRSHLFSLKDAFTGLSQRPPSYLYSEEEESSPKIEEEPRSEKEDQTGEVMIEVERTLSSEKQEEEVFIGNNNSEQEVELTACFPEAHTVELALAPWNWSSVPMERCDSAWKTRARVPSGNEVQFKFIVDGQWRTSEDYPTTRDNHNIENNFINCM